LRKDRKTGHEGCPWFIADAESHYCFFKYMHDDGRPTPPNRVARLLLIDDNDVKRIVQAFRRNVSQFFGKGDDDDPDFWLMRSTPRTQRKP
jgi:hypothetical protein